MKKKPHVIINPYLEIRGIKPIQTKNTKKISYSPEGNLVKFPKIILPTSYNYA